MGARHPIARCFSIGILLVALACIAIGVLFACGSSAPAASSQDLNATSECVDAGDRCVPYDGYHSASGCSHVDPTLKCGDGVTQCCLDKPASCGCEDGGVGCECPPCQEQFGDAAARCSAPGDRLFACTPGGPIPTDAGECNCGTFDQRGTLCCCEGAVVRDE